ENFPFRGYQGTCFNTPVRTSSAITSAVVTAQASSDKFQRGPTGGRSSVCLLIVSFLSIQVCLLICFGGFKPQPRTQLLGFMPRDLANDEHRRGSGADECLQAGEIGPIQLLRITADAGC